jgi:hypothetical protein
VVEIRASPSTVCRRGGAAVKSTGQDGVVTGLTAVGDDLVQGSRQRLKHDQIFFSLRVTNTFFLSKLDLDVRLGARSREIRADAHFV